MPSFGEALQHFLFGSEIEVRKDNGDFTREANTIIDDFVANMSLSNTILKEYLNNKSTPKLESLMKICVELGLNSEKSRDLIHKAGINIDNPTPASKVCRLMLGLSKEKAKEILDHWSDFVNYFSEQSSI